MLNQDKSDKNICMKSSLRETRSSGTTNGVLLDVAKSRTFSFRNSFYIVALKLRERYSISIGSFKARLFKYYKDPTDRIFDQDDPKTLKCVCVKCDTTCSLFNILTNACS